MAENGTVGKACDVLTLVADFGHPVRFARIQARSTLPKATLYRLLQSLTNQRMLAYDGAAQTYAPGMRLVRLAHAAWAQNALAPAARPFLDHLSRDIPETVHLAQLDAGQVLYVDKREANKPVDMYSQAGKVAPAYCTGVGKAMLAFLPEPDLSRALALQSYHRFTDHTLCSERALRAALEDIRLHGVAYDREEHEPGIICIAAPVLNRAGRVLGALSITGPTHRTGFDQLGAWATQLVDTANRIGQEAELWQFPEFSPPAPRPIGTGAIPT